MLIAVGSDNPVKITAVKNAVDKLFPSVECTIEHISVPSGIADQPLSDEESIIGAKQRARLAQERFHADYGFGLEGGVHMISNRVFLTGWAAVYSRNGVYGLGSKGRLELPQTVWSDMYGKQRKELGDVMDQLLNRHNIKQREGSFGVFTKGLIKREKSISDACILAMARFVSPDLYDEKKSLF